MACHTKELSLNTAELEESSPLKHKDASLKSANNTNKKNKKVLCPKNDENSSTKTLSKAKNEEFFCPKNDENFSTKTLSKTENEEFSCPIDDENNSKEDSVALMVRKIDKISKPNNLNCRKNPKNTKIQEYKSRLIHFFKDSRLSGIPLAVGRNICLATWHIQSFKNMKNKNNTLECVEISFIYDKNAITSLDLLHDISKLCYIAAGTN